MSRKRYNHRPYTAYQLHNEKQQTIHYENTPIQIYTWKFHLQKLKISDKKKKTEIFPFQLKT